MLEDEESKPAPSWCARAAFLWLLAALAIDVAVPSTVGVVCGPHCPDHARSGLVYFLQTVWWRMPYFFGESSLDLWAAAVLRFVVFALLGLLRLRRSPRRAASSSEPPAASTRHAAPLLARPLNADLAGDVPAPSSSANAEVAPRLHHRHAMICAWALSVLTCVHVVAKGFGRLLQSGDRSEGNGFGLLPHDGTTPPEVHFWICMVVALVCAEVERRAFESLSEQRPDPPRAHGDDAELGRFALHGGRNGLGGRGGSGGS